MKYEFEGTEANIKRIKEAVKLVVTNSEILGLPKVSSNAYKSLLPKLNFKKIKEVKND